MSHTPGLPHPAPRRWFSLFWALGGWVCVILAIFTLAMTVAGNFAQNDARAFDEEGREVSARIVDKRIDRRVQRTSDGTRTVTNYYVSFAFRAGDREMRVEKKVTKSLYNKAAPGQQQQIRYLQSDPSTIEAYIGASRDSATTALVIQGFVGAGALGSLWWFGGRTNRAVRARRDGRTVPAEIVEVRMITRRRRNTIGKQKYGRVIWRDDQGGVGESLRYPMRKLSDLKIGQTTTVYRLGDESWWEGDVGPRG